MSGGTLQRVGKIKKGGSVRFGFAFAGVWVVVGGKERRRTVVAHDWACARAVPRRSSEAV